MNEQSFESLNAVAEFLRKRLEQKRYALLFAYNGTGKTRLSRVFKDAYHGHKDTLYFSAYTEDLFRWDKDIDEDKS